MGLKGGSACLIKMTAHPKQKIRSPPPPPAAMPMIAPRDKRGGDPPFCSANVSMSVQCDTGDIAGELAQYRGSRLDTHSHLWCHERRWCR